jgi:hypothetical protein
MMRKLDYSRREKLNDSEHAGEAERGRKPSGILSPTVTLRFSSIILNMRERDK